MVLTEGFWRRAVKGCRGATPKPGSMTEYIRQRGLVPSEEIARIIAATPTFPLVKGQIPDWESWMRSIIDPNGKDRKSTRLNSSH